MPACSESASELTPDDILAKYRRASPPRQHPMVLLDLSEDLLSSPPNEIAPPVPSQQVTDMTPSDGRALCQGGVNGG